MLLPKLNHAIEFAPMNHDGADLHAGRRFEAIPTTLNQTADRFPSDAPDHEINGGVIQKEVEVVIR